MSKDKLPTIERKKAADLTPDVENANKGTERGLRALDDSIAEDGMGRSILLDRAGRVIAGNKTLERAVDRGIDDVIVIKTDGSQIVAVQRDDVDLDTEHGRRMAYRDNRIAQLDLDWDGAALLRSQQAGFDLLQVGFNEQDLLDFLPTPETKEDTPPDMSRADELQAVWGVERGQLWSVGRHRLLCGDSYDPDHIDLLMDGQMPDMLHIDPPYGIEIVTPKDGLAGSDGASKPFGSTSGIDRKSSTGFDRARLGTVQSGSKSKNQIIQSNLYPTIEGDDRPFDPEQFLDFAPIVIMWGANYFADKLPTSSGWFCWDKREGIVRNNFADCELAWTNMSKPARVFHHLWNGLHKGSQHNERRTHPTEKPIALFEEIGRMVCPDGLWVDLFAGTGAQMVAAERVGTRCFACEWEPIYVATILQRMADLGVPGKLMDRD